VNGGLDRLILFRQQGISLCVEHFGLWGGGMPKAAWLLAHDLRALDIPVSVTTFHTTDDDIERARARGVSVRRIWWRWGSRWKWPQRATAIGGLAETVRRGCPVLVAIGVDQVAAFLLASRFGRRVVVWECTEASPGVKFVCADAVRRLHRGLAVLVPSQAVEQNVRNTYGYRGPVVRLPFWIDATEADGMNDGDPAPTNDFVFLGRKDSEKGIDELLQAFAEVVRAHPQATLTICGTGTDAPYAKMAEALRIRERVTLTYLPDHSQVGDLIRRTRWLVLPSYHEGYPLTPMEAFARGRPTIATAVGSVPEMCGGDSAAILLPPRDVRSLRDAMLQALAEDSVTYQQRRIAARRCFERISSAQMVRTNLISAFERIAELVRQAQPASYEA